MSFYLIKEETKTIWQSEENEREMTLKLSLSKGQREYVERDLTQLIFNLDETGWIIIFKSKAPYFCGRSPSAPWIKGWVGRTPCLNNLENRRFLWPCLKLKHISSDIQSVASSLHYAIRIHTNIKKKIYIMVGIRILGIVVASLFWLNMLCYHVETAFCWKKLRLQ